MRCLVLVLMAAPVVFGQGLDLKFLDRLADKTDEVVTVTLDESLLRMGAGLLGASKDAADIRGVIAGIKSITVRSFKFEKEGEYAKSDLDSIYGQLKGWSQVVESREKNERTGVWLLRPSDKKLGGVVIVTHAPKELTVVSLIGDIDMEKLGKLSGNFGIPEIEVKSGTPKKEPPVKKEEDEDL